MRKNACALAAALSLAFGSVSAHEPKRPTAAPQQPAMDASTRAAVATVERFGAALKAGDMATVRNLLDERLIVLESGGAEWSREEYMGHHAIADARFLKTASVTPGQRRAHVHGDTAVVGSVSEIRAGEGAAAKTLLSAETIVLRRDQGAWKIVHIHWSSRPKKAGSP